MSDKVVEIRPGVDTASLLTPDYIERRVFQLARECEKAGISVVITIVAEGDAYIYPSQGAYKDCLSMCGALDEAKAHLRGDPVFEIELEDSTDL